VALRFRGIVAPMRVALVIVTLLGSASAFAQPDPQQEELPAVKLFTEGRVALDAGDATLACQKFAESFKLDSTAAGTMLNLGLCNEQLGKLATALKWFRRAQARASETQLTQTEAVAKEKSAALASKVAVVKIVVTSNGKPAVTLDGVPVADVDYGRIELDAGRHVVDATLAGAPSFHHDLVVTDGKTDEVQVRIAVPEAPRPKKYEEIDVGKPQRRRAYILGATGATAMLAAGAFALIGKGQHDDAELPDDRRRWKNIVRYGATPVFLAGSAALVYGIVSYVKAPGKERREVITPVIGADHVGIGFAKQF
jgi:hypothetical protein